MSTRVAAMTDIVDGARRNIRHRDMLACAVVNNNMWYAVIYVNVATWHSS